MRGIAPQFGVELTERTDLAMLAVQGPNARAKVAELLPAEHRAAALALDVFFGRELGDWFVARTGYTGEDGFEIMLPAARAARIWRALNAHGREIRRPRRARHAATRSRHESLRQRHGREPEPARVRPRVDRVLREPRARSSSAARRSESMKAAGLAEEIRRAAARGSRRACAATRRSSSPAPAKVKSPAAPSPRRWRNPSRSPACRAPRAPAGAGRHSRQAIERTRGQSAVRASRQDPG